MDSTQTGKISDIVIVGGGIAGLTLALLLSKAGLKTALVEPKPPLPLKDITPQGRTVALMQGSLNILHAAGITPQEIARHSACLSVMRVVDMSSPSGKTLSADFHAEEIGMDFFGRNIPNEILRALLYESALRQKNIYLHSGAEVTGFCATAHRATVTLEKGGTRYDLEARAVIGADGRNSAIRRLAGIEAAQHSYAQSAVTCIVSGAGHHDTAIEFHRPAGPLAFVPLPGGRFSVVWVESPERAEALTKLCAQDFVAALQNDSLNYIAGLELLAGPQSWPLTSIRAQKLTAPRMALMAEAAHVMSPITAQGLNLSLRDVAVLAEELTDAARLGLDIGSKAVLGRYESRRRLDIRTRVAGVDIMNRMVSTSLLPLAALRRTAFGAVSHVRALRTIAMRQGLAPRDPDSRLAAGEAL